MATLKEMRDQTLEKLSVPTTKILDKKLNLFFAEPSPVCAIVGGVLAQEVIKAISNTTTISPITLWSPVVWCILIFSPARDCK